MDPLRAKDHGLRPRRAAYGIGQIVEHRMFGYIGLIYDVDPVFMHDDDWYEGLVGTQPPKDAPWYHVLVDGETHVTYVAEQSLMPATRDALDEDIEHPLINRLFRRPEPGDGTGDYELRINTN